MIPARCLTTCEDEEDENTTRVAMILGGDQPPACGEKTLLMAPKVKLSSGYDMPVLGFGTYKMRGYQCSTAIHCAVETGYRHFDTAFYYENEKEIGEALRTQIQMGNVSRENIFLTTKLWNTHHAPADVIRICQKQLETLGFDYVDLYLLHFPVAYKHMCDEIMKTETDGAIETTDIDYIDTWRAMEELVRMGLVRSIGVSNFNMDQVQRIIQCSSSKPVVNQVEIWPGFMQKDLVDYCRYNGIVVQAFAPLGQPDRELHTPIYFFSEGMKRLVKKNKRTAAQIVLRYLIDYGVVPIVKAANPLHITQNLDIFDFKLDDTDTRALRGIKQKRRIVKYLQVKDHEFYPFELEEEDEPPPPPPEPEPQQPPPQQKRKTIEPQEPPPQQEPAEEGEV
ncbi:aldo-keto reductase family 1 member B1 [Scaptodrosophila lebanonensis]|uniref:Aldo-keto reductase family 1 member B1 n=1 Tax=Drosophila lebanonensis TaxID=7225 RepID=A0A6J2UBI4_DROLE|nr:aldo-keto reductase family 1 member B1 [Scaptodrosophila lebanonensis]